MFWDSSALVPILLPERSSKVMAALLRTDDAPAVWWTTWIECQSALHRRRREAALQVRAIAPALARLSALMADVDVVQPGAGVLERAARLFGQHPLRAADVMQLAAALAWCEDAPGGERFVGLDARLRDAAVGEGFEVLPGDA